MTIDEAKEIMNKAIENNKEIKFYGRMYGREFFRTIYSDKEVVERDKVIEITTSSLWVDVRDGFGYRWGSPEYNLYLWKDYGKTWAFSIDDFENKLVEKYEEYGWTDGCYTYWIEDDGYKEIKER